MSRSKRKVGARGKTFPTPSRAKRIDVRRLDLAELRANPRGASPRGLADMLLDAERSFHQLVTLGDTNLFHNVQTYVQEGMRRVGAIDPVDHWRTYGNRAVGEAGFLSRVLTGSAVMFIKAEDGLAQIGTDRELLDADPEGWRKVRDRFDTEGFRDINEENVYAELLNMEECFRVDVEYHNLDAVVQWITEMRKEQTDAQQRPVSFLRAN